MKSLVAIRLIGVLLVLLSILLALKGYVAGINTHSMCCRIFPPIYESVTAFMHDVPVDHDKAAAYLSKNVSSFRTIDTDGTPITGDALRDKIADSLSVDIARKPAQVYDERVFAEASWSLVLAGVLFATGLTVFFLARHVANVYA